MGQFSRAAVSASAEMCIRDRVNPIPVKEAMNLMGMNVGGYRLPLCPMSSEYREKLAGIMRQAGLDVK